MDQVHYTPGEIKFTRAQALWLIHNLCALRSGASWPTDATEHVNVPGKKSTCRAPFTTPVEYAAEITIRMERCGLDGVMLLAMECWGESVEALARYFSKPQWSIVKGANQALRYVASGPSPRWITTKKRGGIHYEAFRKGGKRNE